VNQVEADNTFPDSYTDLRNSYQKLESAYVALKEEKEIQVYVLETALGLAHTSSINKQLSELSIVAELNQLKDTKKTMSSEQWLRLKTSVDMLCPRLPKFIEKNYPEISVVELQIVYLTRTFFKSGQAMNLMGIKGKSAFSMRKDRLLERLFGLENGGAVVFNHIIESFE
jgi:hypothetical protein